MVSARILAVTVTNPFLPVLRQALGSEPSEIVIAASGEEALRLLGQKIFDVVVLDPAFAELDGAELIGRIMARYPGLAVLVLAPSGGKVSEGEKLNPAQGKPASAEGLRAVVGRILASREAANCDAVDYPACIGLSRRFAYVHRLQEAVTHARRAAGIDPSRPEAFNLLGAYCEARGEPLEAQRYYRAALELDPSYGPAKHNLNRLVERRKGSLDLGQG